MEESEADKKERTANILKWVVSSGLTAALIGVWGTLFGLLYRTGWLAGFGVAPDVFLPGSAAELTLWSYLALLETWSQARSQIWTAVAWFLGWATLGVAIGAALAFAMWKLDRRLRKMRKDARVQATAAMAGMVSAVGLAPLALIAVAAVLLFPPGPAYLLGKQAAARSIERHVAAGSGDEARCYRLLTASGTIGTCPMVIAQTADRIVFFDDGNVTVISSAGVQITWKVPTTPRKE